MNNNKQKNDVGRTQLLPKKPVNIKNNSHNGKCKQMFKQIFNFSREIVESYSNLFGYEKITEKKLPNLRLPFPFQLFY